MVRGEKQWLVCYIPPGAQALMHLTKAVSAEDWAGSTEAAVAVWALPVVDCAAAKESAPAKMRVVKKRMVAVWNGCVCITREG